MKWLTKKLSSEQLAAFNTESQKTCILASAGSGKTRTLVSMVVRDLIAGKSPENIIAFTFTNKAADELLSRIVTIVKQNVPDIKTEGLFIGTIHSWCFHYLQENDQFINFEAMDELNQFTLLSRFYDFLGLGNIYGLAFPRAIPEFMKDLEIFHNEMVTPNEIPNKIQLAVTQFQELLITNRMLTFGDIIRSTIGLLKNNGPVAELERAKTDWDFDTGILKDNDKRTMR